MKVDKAPLLSVLLLVGHISISIALWAGNSMFYGILPTIVYVGVILIMLIVIEYFAKHSNSIKPYLIMYMFHAPSEESKMVNWRLYSCGEEKMKAYYNKIISDNDIFETKIFIGVFWPIFLIYAIFKIIFGYFPKFTAKLIKSIFNKKNKKEYKKSNFESED